jgi:hypothetical protein
MVAMIGGFEVMAAGCIGWDENYVVQVIRLWLARRCSSPFRTCRCSCVSGV